MVRIVLSLALAVAAIAWSALALLVIFLFVPHAWDALFGPVWAPFAALTALGGAVWSSGKMMRLADRLAEEPSLRRPSAPEAQPNDDELPDTWHDYTAEIVRNKRWAFYRRTRQFERLAELEEENRRRASP
jgi:hypothetical protein